MDFTGLNRIADNLSRIKKNVEFANAVALTRTAQAGQTDVRTDLKSKFTLRNTWTERGIRISPATPDKLEAEVYSKDWYMTQQEEGAQRAPKEGEDSLFLRGEDFYRVTKAAENRVVAKRYRPGPIVGRKINKNVVYKGRFRSGAGFIGVAKPASEMRKGERRFYILYILVKKRANIRARKFFFSNIDAAWNKRFQKNYDDAWKQYVLGGIR